MNRRVLRVAVPVALGVVATGAAWGFWSGGVAAGSNGKAPIASVQSVGAPSASATGSTVTVTWPAGTLSDGTAVSGYVVSRRNEGSGVVVAATNGCSGTVAATSCTESGVPDGTWSYSVTPRFATSWTGPASPWSSPLTVDATGPSGGSVAATGLTGTGPRWSRSLGLSLALSTGTDPSGLATSGAQLLRSEATVSSAGTAEGACGTWSAYSSLATDPASPYADTVPTTARCYRYQYVVADSRGNTTTYTSSDVRVDTTAPGAPSLTAAGITSSSASGTTVYYRPSVAGSFRVTAAGSDLQSGIASTAFPTFGTGWTRTGTNPATYSWTAGAAAPGSGTVTVTNHAGAVSPAASFTVVADSSAPSGGSVSYADGATTADHVTVTVNPGTDGGSGIATRQLQRATAPLSGGACGTFGAFGTAVHPAAGGGSVSEPVSAGTCYAFRYVVTDAVGNTQTYTSPSVVRATESGYAVAVRATAGVTSYWRLGERHLGIDSFAGAAGSTVQSRSGESTGWTRFAYSTTDAVLTAAGRVRRVGATGGSTQGVAVYSTVEPDSADYSVGADLYVASLVPGDAVALTGRFSLDNYASAYAGAYDQSTQSFQLHRVVGATRTLLASTTVPPLTVGRTYRLELRMQGSSVALYVDGAQVVSYVDAPATTITTRGEGGFAFGWGNSPSAGSTDTTGFHIDNFRITNLLRDAVGSGHGVHIGTPNLGQGGALASDLDTAAELDGTARGLASATLGTNCTLELWFRTSQGSGAGTSWTDGSRLVEATVNGVAAAGISVTSDGHVVAGAAGMPSSVLSATGGYADGQWHHVVFVRAVTGDVATLYVDGTPVGSLSGVGTPVTGQATITFGAAGDGTRGFVGRLDEVALYANTALEAGTVSTHYASR